MALQRDEQGFLVGDQLRTSEITDQLDSIHGELKAIRAVLGDAVAVSPAVAKAEPASSVVASVVRRNDGPKDRRPIGAAVSTVSQRSSSATLQSARQPMYEHVSTPAKASKAERDSSGRFAALADSRSATESSGEAELGRAVLGMGDRLAGAVSELGAGSEEADPSVKAFNEIAQPLSRGFGKIFGGGGSDRKQERWYRRFWRQMTQKSRDDKDAAKDSQRSLKDIERASAGEEGGGSGGGLSLAGIGGMLMKLPGVAVLGSAISSLLGFIRPLGPLVGKLALPVTAIFSAVKSFGTSTEEYAARMGIELNGGLAQALGVRFVGVLGDLGNTITFGLAGKFGELIAPYASATFEAIGATWNAAVETFKGAGEKIGAAWDATLEWFQGKWEGALGKVGEWIEGIANFGKDTKETIVKTTERVVEKAGDVKEGVSSWVSEKADQVASSFGGGSKGRKQALQKEMVNAGITDPREKAMFMAQMEHESDGFKASEESFKYRSAEQVMAASGSARKHGKPAVEAAMAQGPEAIAELMYGGRMGNTEKGDAHKFRGRGATQLTGKNNYTAASKDLGIDLINNPDLAADPEIAAKVATWFWKKNNIGEAARKGDVTAVTKRVNGGTNGLADRKAKYEANLAAATKGSVSLSGGKAAPASVSPAAIPMAIDRDATTVTKPLAVPTAVPTGNRHAAVTNNAKPANASAGVPLPSMVAPTMPVAMASPPGVPSVRTAIVPAIPDAPTITVPMGADANASGAPQSRPMEVSRDVPDRRIAHVVTGAYSSMG